MNKVTSLCAMVLMPKVVVYPQHDIVGLLLCPEVVEFSEFGFDLDCDA